MVHIVEIDDSTERHDDLADIDENISDDTSEAESEDEPGEEADATSMPSELKTLSGLVALLWMALHRYQQQRCQTGSPLSPHLANWAPTLGSLISRGESLSCPQVTCALRSVAGRGCR